MDLAPNNPKPAPADNDVFSARWAAAQPLITSYIASVTGRFHDTEDLVQKVAIAAFKKSGEYDPSRPFNGWVVGIARLEIMRWRRDCARDRLVFSDDVISRIEQSHVQQSDELEARRVALRACFSKLEGRPRRFMEMRYLRDMSPQAIAEQSGLQPTAVRVMLHRIRQALQKCMSRRMSQGGGRDG